MKLRQQDTQDVIAHRPAEGTSRMPATQTSSSTTQVTFPASEPVSPSVDRPSHSRDQRRSNPPSAENGLEQALNHVRDQLVDGLRHGFFELTITCELVKDRKRRLVVKSGKSEQFTIPPDEAEQRW
jgi:hypothetical protein